MELYEKVFGPYLGKGHKTGHDILINCLWHKDENASLAISTDPNKETFYCHGCGRKGSLIKAFMDLNNLSYSEALKALDMDKPYENRPVRQPIIPVKPPKEDIDYLDYIVKASSNVFDNAEFFCKKLYDYRGITMPTAVCCQIGYDHTKGWIFPVIRYSDNKVVGYEVREKFFQMFKFKDGKETKCYKAKGTPSCLCTVFEGWEKKKAVVCEGFVDSYFMWQYLHEKAQKEHGPMARVEHTILTSSCGVKELPTFVEEAKLWDDFDEVIFVVDNDPWKWCETAKREVSPGNEAKQKIMSLPHNDKFKFFSRLKEGWDFEDYYKKVWVHNLTERR